MADWVEWGEECIRVCVGGVECECIYAQVCVSLSLSLSRSLSLSLSVCVCVCLGPCACDAQFMSVCSTGNGASCVVSDV
jgi:hypothetical protein